MPSSGVRYKITLGKFPVKRVLDRGTFLEFIIELPNSVTLQVTGPLADVREGDLLTLYTEVLTHAKTLRAPIK